MIKILLPVYNEAESIYDLLENYSKLFENYPLEHCIYVVDDNSSDITKIYIQKALENFKNLTITNIKNDKNIGLAEILKQNIAKIVNESDDNDILITMDGDNTHDPFVILLMLPELEQGSNIVIASRYCKESKIIGLSKKRIFLSIGAKFLYKLVWNIKGVKDYTSNFRAYKISILKNLLADMPDNFITEKNFSAVGELLKNLTKYSPIISEVPMVLNYSNKKNASNMKLMQTIIHTLKILMLKK